ncbi:osmoprotectant NAGGN system M42 family peptidase [Desulfobulbus alkaliphilus]|uniref:osmoprotectant NAGGN system M42 family peptidase n=1 Tax=Desulfobulbus alkaliphilus TaxID=869814 RepID=UPI001964457E|nr:osmoprotectant NAGGN system M42 family peptidase [Desulfobulbus alkaliphilus]MBM9535627.1 osmoprotectant NAGGN system M42 family peptidase [Desulfobulbus alkaliphilus]
MLNRIDSAYMEQILERLLHIPSPSGMTDDVVRAVCSELEQLAIPYELTRRGAIRARIKGQREHPRRAVVAHLDTLGAMVKGLKKNGRLSLVPIGTWSARFAEGARVTVHSDSRRFRGAILPLKASGHRYNEEVDAQPAAWSNLEIRLDEICSSLDVLWDLGLRVGDYVSIDPGYESSASGHINARHLDDKAGVAAILAAAKALKEQDEALPLDCYLLFTISEEVGVGASHILHGDVAEMVSVDNGTIAPDQNTIETGVTLAMKDSSGPFDMHLTRHLINLCMQHEIEFSRDVFLFYRSDSAAALEAGNDIRTALICFGLDASHGYERLHIQSLRAVAALVMAYLQSPPLFAQDENVIGPEQAYPLINPSSEQRPRES